MDNNTDVAVVGELCEVMPKKYNQKQYNATYYLKNKEKFKQKYTCVDCNKEILCSNRFNHENTMKHILKSQYKIDIVKKLKKL